MKISKYLTGGKGVGSQDPNCDNYRTFFSTLTPSLTSVILTGLYFDDERLEIKH